MMKIISGLHVVVAGGTHGNERTGIETLIRLKALFSEKKFEQFKYITTELILMNKKASFEASHGRRGIHEDLNRVWDKIHFDEDSGVFAKIQGVKETEEILRAIEIANHLKPQNRHRNMFIIDMHNTTSHMGNTIIVLESNEDDFNLSLANFLKNRAKEFFNILYIPKNENQKFPYFIPFFTEFGIALELGSLKHGESDERMTEIMIQTCLDSLNYLDDIQKSEKKIASQNIELVKLLTPVFTNNRRLNQALIGKDYAEISNNFIVFYDQKNNPVTFSDVLVENNLPEDQSFTVVFVDEHAYSKPHESYVKLKQNIQEISFFIAQNKEKFLN